MLGSLAFSTAAYAKPPATAEEALAQTLMVARELTANKSCGLLLVDTNPVDVEVLGELSGVIRLTRPAFNRQIKKNEERLMQF